MVTITADAEKFITDLLAKNNKTGYGIKIYHFITFPLFLALYIIITH